MRGQTLRVNQANRVSEFLEIMPMKIMLIVGARPNFMKAMPILAAIQERNRQRSRTSPAPHLLKEIQPILVHTGQHYDRLMSDQFFSDLDLPKPDFHLGVGSGTHAQQTAEIMRRFEEILMSERPDMVVLVGDVNSTLACALVTSKVAFDAKGTRPLIAHVEAGLRSFDKSMPEEINRIVTDQVSDLLFATEESGVRNLEREGVPSEKIHFVGNTMIDSLLGLQDKADSSSILADLGLRAENVNGSGGCPKQYALLTLHRPSNVDQKETFREILEGIRDLAESCPVIFPTHPRTKKQIREFGLESFFATEAQGNDAAHECANAANGVRLTEPLGYLDFLCLMKHAALVITDSGGIQEETTSLGIPCVTVRTTTERPVTVTHGTNRVAGVDAKGIREAARLQLQYKGSRPQPALWDGKSAERILSVICDLLEKSR
jgi:UDP-N-acetylglucosamine 2-epimerase (non-hydrolysing)